VAAPCRGPSDSSAVKQNTSARRERIRDGGIQLSTSSSQAAGGAFIERLAQRTEDLDTPSGPDVVGAQMAAFREWERSTGTASAISKGLPQPTLVVNGIHDEMIPVSNSYRLAENLPNAALLAYPDSGHGSLFQFHDSFTRQAAAFLASDAPFAAY